MITFTCPECNKRINAPDSTAGKQATCPSCKSIMKIPPALVEEIADEEEAPPATKRTAISTTRRRTKETVPDEDEEDQPPPSRKRRRDLDEDREDRPARRKARRDEEEDDSDERPRRRRKRRGPSEGTPIGRTYAICYNCGADAASKVSFTWWGGLVGPAMFCHVECRRCGTTYNGNTGKSNNTAIAIYVGVTLVLALGIVLLSILAQVMS